MKILGIFVLVVVVLLDGLTPRPVIAAGPSAAAQRLVLSRCLAIIDRGIGADLATRDNISSQVLATLGTDSDLAMQSWLREPLEVTPPNLPQARDRLQAALTALDEPARLSGDASAERVDLNAILAEPRFHPRDLLSYVPGWLLPVAVLISTILHAFDQVLTAILNRLVELLVRFLDERAFTVIVLGVAGVVVPAIVFLYVRTVRGILVSQAEVAAQINARDLAPIELLDAARRAADHRDFRDACHFAFLAALRVVEDRADIRIDYSATNREQLRRLASAPVSVASRYVEVLRPLVDRFDRLWYGQAEAGLRDFQEIYELVARVREVSE